MPNDDDRPGDDYFDTRHADERAILFRLDERTERIDDRITRLDSRLDKRDDASAKRDNRLDEHDVRISRNTTILNALTFGLASIVTAIVAKLQGLLNFL